MRLCSIPGMLVLAGALGWTSLALALPSEVKLGKPAQLEIIRNGKPAGKLSLAAGTALEVMAVDGDFVQVRYRGVTGRVLSAATDLDARVAAEESGDTAEPAKDDTPPPKAAGPAKVSAPTPVVPPPAKVTASPATGPAQAPGVKPAAPAHATTPVTMAKPAWGLGWLLGMWAAFFLILAAQWRLFTKARKPGWASLVPIYNIIVWQQISGKPVWWILLYFVPLVNLVLMVLTTFGLAKNFGKDAGFGFGLLLLPMIFLPLLAFGDAKYIGN